MSSLSPAYPVPRSGVRTSTGSDSNPVTSVWSAPSYCFFPDARVTASNFFRSVVDADPIANVDADTPRIRISGNWENHWRRVDP